MWIVRLESARRLRNAAEGVRGHRPAQLPTGRGRSPCQFLEPIVGPFARSGARGTTAEEPIWLNIGNDVARARLVLRERNARSCAHRPMRVNGVFFLRAEGLRVDNGAGAGE